MKRTLTHLAVLAAAGATASATPVPTPAQRIPTMPMQNRMGVPGRDYAQRTPPPPFPWIK